MNVKEYQEKAHGTSMNTNIFGSKLLYPVLGLADELGEVHEKVSVWLVKNHSGDYINMGSIKEDTQLISELKKELGDVLWYFQEICTQWEISMDGYEDYLQKAIASPKSPVNSLIELTGNVSKLYGKIKKRFRDGDKASSDKDIIGDLEFKKVMDGILRLSFENFAVLCYTLGISLQEVADMNIEKLYSRLDRNKITGSGDNR